MFEDEQKATLDTIFALAFGLYIILAPLPAVGKQHFLMILRKVEEKS
ncbi:MAG: hypothetical protein OIN84_21125 [Candidatus Methanoperedens sp.]|nr:hypothetical protein [Candidatus Methanoperedens sp. BLZ2]MBZ0176755.1 hypothetical protein [Candidatus Methanoperedens nitroreducens]MCX9080476.1 hypothetical protein [Candidatus Methanoperedens sp.]